MIEAGTPAPEFELKADDGSTVTLAGLELELRGRGARFDHLNLTR